MDAVNQLIRDGLIAVNKEEAEKKDSEIVKSMPSIFKRAKTSLLDTKHPADLSKINKLSKIFENAQDKENGARTLEQLNLPRYKRIKTTIGEFLQNPEKYFNSLRSNLYFPSAMDAKTGVRHFELGLDEEATVSFVKDLIDKQVIFPDYAFTLSEYQKNEISGNITINPILTNGNNRASEHSGEINIEIVDGEHTALAYGDKSPILIAKTNLMDNHPDIMNFDVTLKTMEFSKPLMMKVSSSEHRSYVNFLLLKKIIEDGKIYWPFLNSSDRKKDQATILRYQKLIEKTTEVLNLIPKDQDNGSNFSVNGKAFHPGYYEFIVNPVGESFFIDYRKADHYSNLQQSDLEGREISD